MKLQIIFFSIIIIALSLAGCSTKTPNIGVLINNIDAQIGVAQNASSDLRTGTDQFVQALMQSNSYLRRQGRTSYDDLDGREAIRTRLTGQSNVTGKMENVMVYTSRLESGGLFYLITIVPGNEESSYNRAFNEVVRSLIINE